MIQVKNLQKSYGKSLALSNISFEIKNGTSYGILGTAGSGKTTLLNILSGCIPASFGSVLIDGIPISDYLTTSPQKIGYTPQNPKLYPEMTVLESLDYFATLKRIKKEKRKAIDLALKTVSFSAPLSCLAAELSPLEKRTLAFAGAILGEPTILLLDEPTYGLSVADAAKIKQLIRTLSSSRTLIYASCNLPEVEEICGDVLIINNGRIAVNTSITKLSANASGLCRLRLRLLANKKKADSLFKKFDQTIEVETMASVEPETQDYIIYYSPDKEDLRLALWKEAVHLEIPILEISKMNISLEEIFNQVKNAATTLKGV